MQKNTIQTTGTYDVKENYFSLSICPNDSHSFTLEGLSVEDMKEIKSLVDILLEGYYDDLRENQEKTNEVWEELYYPDESGTKKETMNLIQMEDC